MPVIAADAACGILILLFHTRETKKYWNSTSYTAQHHSSSKKSTIKYNLQYHICEHKKILGIENKKKV